MGDQSAQPLKRQPGVQHGGAPDDHLASVVGEESVGEVSRQGPVHGMHLNPHARRVTLHIPSLHQWLKDLGLIRSLHQATQPP